MLEELQKVQEESCLQSTQLQQQNIIESLYHNKQQEQAHHHRVI
jgi:hypothetical protein